MELTSQARNALHQVEQELRRQSVVTRSPSNWINNLLAWCEDNYIDLGPHWSQRVLHFDQGLIDKINQALQSQGKAAVNTSLSGLSSEQQAKHGVDEDKANRERPRAHRVLVNLPGDLPGWLGKASRVIHDLDWRGIQLDACDGLIQIENLDSFYDIAPNWQALSACQQPLVVYRGDSHYGGGFSRLADAWRNTGKPHYYVGDFDVKGVSIALSSNATALLVPPLQWLQHHATGFHDPPKQLKYHPALERHRNALPAAHPLQPYLAILLGSHRGLRQQWFETLVSVPLHQE